MAVKHKPLIDPADYGDYEEYRQAVWDSDNLRREKATDDWFLFTLTLITNALLFCCLIGFIFYAILKGLK